MRYSFLLVPALLVGASPSAAATDATTVTMPSQGQAQPADKVICKKRVKTGTLASYEKSCHTRAEWDRIGQAWRDTWGEVQGKFGSTHGN